MSVGGDNANFTAGLNDTSEHTYKLLRTDTRLNGYFDSTAGTEDTSLSATFEIPADGQLDIGRDVNGSVTAGLIRDLKIYSVPPEFSDAEVIAL